MSEITVTLPKKEYDRLVRFSENWGKLCTGEIMLSFQCSRYYSSESFIGTEDAVKRIQSQLDARIKQAMLDDIQQSAQESDVAKRAAEKMKSRSWYSVFFRNKK